MNILFLSPASIPDYQCDMLMHGLRSNYGSSLIDYPKMPYMYSDYGDLSLLYGKGFTLYGLLPDHDIDRNNIPRKILNHFFDLIIYGSIQRSIALFDLVRQSYERHEVIFIDGEDQSQFLNGLSDYGIYFKRELYQPHPGIYPIHFAIPKSKIGTCGPLLKNKVVASIDPRDRSTYIYDSESAYYRGYHESLFAHTCRKAGWDALRHYEILANGCIPLFWDLEQCPPLTCSGLPKEELLEARREYERHPTEFWDTEEGHSVWLSLWRRIHLRFSRYCTTSMLAQYVIETQMKEAAISCPNPQS